MRERGHVRASTSEKTFDCEICGAVLKSRLGLANHKCLFHDECRSGGMGNPITFRCATCAEAFALRGELLAHLRQHGHGHPMEPDPLRPPGAQRLRGRPRRRGG